jgi:ADP-heptose:LPS heptosyltransferase
VIFPNARIIVSVDPVGEEVLRYNPDIDEIFVLDRNRKSKTTYFLNKYKGWRDIKSQKLDLLIDLYSGHSSCNFLRWSGAKLKTGFCHSQLKSNSYNINLSPQSEFEITFHLSKKLLQIISIFDKNYKVYSCKPIFITRSSTDEKMKKYLKTFNLDKTYLLNLGSGGSEKILSSDKSFEQVKYIYESFGYSPLVVCNPGQESLQQEFIERYLIPRTIPHGALDLLNLEEVGSMMKLNNFIITPDTGLYHIAIAIGIPIIGIFTYTNPVLVEPESGLYVNCFQSDSKIHDDPMSYGKNDLDMDYLLKQTAFLLDQLKI